MKQYIFNSKIVYLLSLMVLILVAWGCTDRLVDNDSTPVTVKMETSISVGDLADIITVFRLTVTAPDMEPIIAIRLSDGGPLVFELDIPAGAGRTFVLEGFALGAEDIDFLGDPIYRGSAVADIEPNVAVDLTIHMEPVVPLVRFTPIRTVVASGQSFSVKLEVFNLPGLTQTELLVRYDATRLTIDTVLRGAGLDATDVLESGLGGDPPGLSVTVYDPTATSAGIVDETGYSHLATINFTSNIEIESAVTFLEIIGLSYTASSDTNISPADVFSHMATVEITSFAGALLRFVPSDTLVMPDEVFGLKIEGHNLLTLYQADLRLVYDESLLTFDSIANGASLMGSDAITVSEGAAAGTLNLSIYDPNGVAGSIVDAEGYSHMATVYFTALRPQQPVLTEVEITPLELFASEAVGGSIPISTVTVENAAVTIASFLGVTMSFMTDQTDITSSEYFELQVELYNMPNLSEIQFSLLFEPDYVSFDSVTKGISLDATDAVWLGEGPGAGPIITVQDTTGGLIVDSQGRSSLVTVYFGTNIIDQSLSTTVAPSPISFTLISGGSIPTDNVTLEDATLNVSAFPDSILTFDPGLENAIRDKLLIYEPTPIYLSDVVFVDTLDASGYAILSIEGLEVFANLRTLDLSVNDITDITPLAQLPLLDSLSLSENDVSDLSPLEMASNLTFLHLKENQITNISSLADLYNLVWLDLSNYGESSYPNAISDLSPLQSLSQLQHLDLSWNYTVSNIAALTSLTNLIWVDLSMNDISNVTPLTNLASVTYLNLSSNSIVDIAPLANGTVLQGGDYVYLWNNPIDPDACNTYMMDLITREVYVYQNSCMYTR